MRPIFVIEVPPLVGVDGEAFGFEDADSLANRRAGHLEFGDQVGFRRQRVAIRQFPPDDRIADPLGDQFGRLSAEDPLNPNAFNFFGITAGDTLRAFINTPYNLDAVMTNPGTALAGWTLESNGRGPGGVGSAPQNSGQGPGGGEFYFEDELPRNPALPPIGVATEQGATTVGLSGYAGGKLAKLVDYPIVAENDCIEQVEDVHLILEHMITSALRERMRAAAAGTVAVEHA